MIKQNLGKKSNEGDAQQTNPLVGKEQPVLTLQSDQWRVVMRLSGNNVLWGEVNDATWSRARSEVNEFFEGLSF